MLACERVESAREGFLDCLALAGHVGDQFNVAEALAGLATLAAVETRWEDAARLAGASAALHTRIGAPEWQSVTAIRERALAGRALGEERYAALFEEGQQLSAEDAVRLQRGPAEAGVST